MSINCMCMNQKLMEDEKSHKKGLVTIYDHIAMNVIIAFIL